MKREFLENITGKGPQPEILGYRDLAKAKLAEPSQDDDSFRDSAWGEELDRRIAYAAQTRKTPEGIQEAIFKLQVEKQKIMEELRLKLRQLDNPKKYGALKPPSNSRWVAFDKATKRYRVTGKHTEPITLGQMMTGGRWGIDFHPLDSLSRAERKRFYIEEAKRRMKDLLDRQILLDEANSEYTGDFEADTYREMIKTRDLGIENAFGGLLAEQMVESLMTQIMYDVPGVFTITESDPEVDVGKKADFFVETDANLRGVGVNKKDGMLERKGIQFTIQSDPEKLANKRAQVARSRRWLDRKKEDLVLVHIPLEDVTSIYRAWKEKKPTGGPEAAWSSEIKRNIFCSIMEGLLPPDEIRNYAERAFPSLIEPANTSPQKKAA